MRAGDATGLAALLNEIIARGGTTALEEAFSPDGLAAAMLAGPGVLCCFVAAAADGTLVGFQSLTRSEHLPADVGEIGTFVRVGLTQSGVGRELFEATRLAAAGLGLSAIHASIRADNAGGLRFYGRLGFVDHDVRRGVPLRDGTPVDRVGKRFALAGTGAGMGAGTGARTGDGQPLAGGGRRP